MPTITHPQDTSFSFDILGRYGCNTLDEALDSALPSRGHIDARAFDHLVIGAGSFGAVVATRLFNRDHRHAHRVLVLEAGPLALPEHVQNLPPNFAPPNKSVPGTVWGQPWESDSPAARDRGFPGLAYCIGGRSVFWGGWSPYFIDSELTDPAWPASVVQDLTTPVLPAGAGSESYLEQAARLLGTDQTNDFAFGPLHQRLRQALFDGLVARAAGAPAGADTLTGNRGALDNVDDLEAPLAVASAAQRPGSFASNKFSSVQLLLRGVRVAQAEAEAVTRNLQRANVFKRLMVVDNCHVTRLERSGDRITRVHVRAARYQCSAGVFTRTLGPEEAIDVPPGGRVFLALGTIENTRAVLNTIADNGRTGRNLMAHLRSNLTFRLPRSAFGAALDPAQQPTPEQAQAVRELQIAALFVKGIHTHAADGSLGHYHFQITGSGVGQLGMNSEAELFKKIPNIEELDQFRDLTDPWVVVTVRGIGEMVGDKRAQALNRVTTTSSDGLGVPRALVRLTTRWEDPGDPRATDGADHARTKDSDLWDAMDATSVEVAATFATLAAPGAPIQYLSRPNDADNAHWQSDPPPNALRRDSLASTHHEAGTLWMGEQAGQSVTDPLGRVWETQNLYVIGPALLPTIGSPNPMLSGVALARRTADRLIVQPDAPPPGANYEWLFDGSARTFHRWRCAGPGGFALRDGLLVAQPSFDQTLLWYAAEAFDNFVLRAQFRLPGPVDHFGKAIGNSGLFVRFRFPHTQWADVNAAQPEAASNPAWVATRTGFEVQIDEQGKSFYWHKHRTGAIYDIAAGDTVGGQVEPIEQVYTAFDVLAPQRWYEMEVRVEQQTYTVRMREAPANQPVQWQQVTRYVRPNDGPNANRGEPASGNISSGYIGIQAHTEAVAFRSIRIRRL